MDVAHTVSEREILLVVVGVAKEQPAFHFLDFTVFLEFPSSLDHVPFFVVSDGDDLRFRVFSSSLFIRFGCVGREVGLYRSFHQMSVRIVIVGELAHNILPTGVNLRYKAVFLVLFVCDLVGLESPPV